VYCFPVNRLGYARVSHGGLSDTEVQMGRFRFPQAGSSASDNDHLTTDPEQVERDVLFNPVLVRLLMCLLLFVSLLLCRL